MLATLTASAAHHDRGAGADRWQYRFFTTGDAGVLGSLAASIAGEPMAVERLAWQGTDLVPVRRWP